MIAGEITLQQAKAYGRDLDRHGNPVKSETPKKATKRRTEPTLTPCLCGCGELTAKNFRPGHDMRMVSLAKAYVRGEATPSEDQMTYLQESGKLDRAKAQVEKEDRRKQERAQKKAQKQREREGAVEKK